jgi:hypothetical protein
MTARVATLFTLCMLTTGAAMVPDVEIPPASELQAASRLARDEKTTDPLAPAWGLAEAWGWLGGVCLMQGDSQKAMTALQRALEIRKDFWWVSRVAMPQARRPALMAFDDGPARWRSALVPVRLSFGVAEWLEAVWAVMRSVFAYGNAWSHALLFGRG